MNKFSLKTGHIVTLRNGKTYMVFRNCMYHDGKDVLVDKNNGWFNLDNFNEDMTFNERNLLIDNPKKWDIMKVAKTAHPFDLVREYGNVIVIWERQEAKKITVSEIEKILGYKVEIIAEK